MGGIVSVLNADLIETVDYLPGSYGVQYGRTLGGVVDVKTKTTFPEQNKFSWSTDVLDSGGLLQVKAGDYGVAVAGAIIHRFVHSCIHTEHGFCDQAPLV